MSKTNYFETEWLEYILNNDPIRNFAGYYPGLVNSATTGSLGLALFTADPGEAGSVVNEADYTGYARATISRDGSYWNVVDDVATLAASVTFAACSGGTNSITHFAICYSTTATTSDLIMYNALTAPLSVVTGVTPQFTAGNLTITEY